MQNVLKQKVTVQPGGIVHIELPELVPGSDRYGSRRIRHAT